MAQNHGNVIQFSGKSHTSGPNHSYQGAKLKEENLLGKKITEARKNLKLSQKDLAEKMADYDIQVSAGAISKWEKGDSMPNPYQLFALCYALQIDNVLSYFTGAAPEACDFSPELSQKGLNLLQLFKEVLVSSGQYAPRSRRGSYAEPEEEIEVKVYDEPAAAGPGNPLSEGSFEMVSYPISLIPEGTDFGIRVSGVSMYPRYVDRQVVYVEQTEEIYNGEIGVFCYDGEAYIKKYVQEQPSAAEVQDYINEDGMIVPKITLMSLNRECEHLDVHVTPGHEFRIIGRVLN